MSYDPSYQYNQSVGIVAVVDDVVAFRMPTMHHEGQSRVVWSDRSDDRRHGASYVVPTKPRIIWLVIP